VVVAVEVVTLAQVKELVEVELVDTGLQDMDLLLYEEHH
jgi:hypothetical protein